MEFNIMDLIFAGFNIIIVFGLVCITIYGFVLFVKLATRGIKALDIYIEEKSRVEKDETL